MSETNGHPTAPLDTTTTDGTKPLQSFPGPEAKGKQTTVTLYNRAQLIGSGFLPPLESLINIAFASRTGAILPSIDRLRREGQYLEELGHAPDTFVYIVSAVDSGELIATAYASRFEGVSEWPEGPGERTWERLGVAEEGTNAWELHQLAVSPDYQRQGLAEYLIRLVDAEIVRREVSVNGVVGKKLVLYISTIKQTNEAFYLRKGFEEVYSVDWPPGHLGSETGFTVAHMDREIKV